MQHCSRWLGLALCAALSCTSVHALAQPLVPNDPYRYDLRFGIFPVAFQAGISQSHFGSAARAEFDVTRHLGLQVGGQLPWANVAGQTEPQTWSVRVGGVIHLVDHADIEPMSGTIYPEDTPVVGGPGPGTDTQLTVPISQRMGGPRLIPPGGERTGKAPMRKVQSFRFGYEALRVVERARPDDAEGKHRYLLNTFHAVYLGYGWGAHWNLNSETGGGERRVGWRRFFADVVLTAPGTTKTKPVSNNVPTEEPDFFPVGLRVGMEGAIDALVHSAPGLGFGYSLELGALPGRSGLEGVLMVALGVEFDVATRPAR
jgi:hypothetical protein